MNSNKIEQFELELVETYKHLARSVGEGQHVYISEDNTMPEKLAEIAKIVLHNVMTRENV